MRAFYAVALGLSIVLLSIVAVAQDDARGAVKKEKHAYQVRVLTKEEYQLIIIYPHPE